MPKNNTILEIKNVDKRFPGVHALKDVSFSVYRGEVHGLVGENGAGKSTLIKSITGAYQYDMGDIIYYGAETPLRISDPLMARANGIAAAYQDRMIAPELTVGENFFLGKIPKSRYGLTDWKMIFSTAQQILDENDIHVDARAKIKSLTVSQQAMVTVAKLSSENAKLVIFDEPTALLPNQEVDVFFDIVGRMKQNGVTIIYISHRLDEVMDICDRVTVLKDGVVVDTKPVAELDESKMISMMVGRDMSEIYQLEREEPGEEILRVENLCRKGVFENISFSLRRGEILGVFGLIGSGRTEVMRCIFGADHLDNGTIRVLGEEVKIRRVKDALNHSIGLVPEDRRGQGLALGLSVTHNVNMADYSTVSRAGLVSRKREKQRSEKYIQSLNIKAYSGRQVVRNLSGGNQQKVVFSKVLCKKSQVLILDEPTVGVDVGAKSEMYQLMNTLTGQGHGIIFVTSYLPELLGLSDRIIVFYEGGISGGFSRKELADMSTREAEEAVLSLASNLKGVKVS